jgi:hypothetical protein
LPWAWGSRPDPSPGLILREPILWPWVSYNTALSKCRHFKTYFFHLGMCKSLAYLRRLCTLILGIFLWVTEQDFCHKTEIPVAMTRGFKEYMFLKC